MIRQIIDSILQDITALNFSDTVAGCVITANRNVIDKDNRTIRKSFPIYWNDRTDTCQNYSDYMDLVPNDKKKSIIYWEENGLQMVQNHGGFAEFRASVTLVCWCNLKLINQFFTDATEVKLNLINAIPEFPQNVGNLYSFIRFIYTGEQQKSNAIFNRYTYNEEEKQYLLYPFDYFALNYDVLFYAGKECVQPITINPAAC